MVTTVVNIKNADHEVYIGRGSKWGNPFSMNGTSDAERVRVCLAYEDYFWKSGLVNNLYEIRDKVLGCHCKPKMCHGDFLARLCDNNFKIIIAGSRNFDNFNIAERSIVDFIRNEIGVGRGPLIEIISGKAKGADRLGELFAKKYNLQLTEFPADWNTFGKKAGPIRNVLMGDYAGSDGVLIAFWDMRSRGTKHMIDTAFRRGMKVCVVDISNL